MVGGGNIARNYQKAALKITQVLNEDKDWLGIHATRINAYLLRIIFKKEASPIIFDKRFKLKRFNKNSVIIGSGWKPGWSTDFVTVQVAADLRVKKAIILGKPDYVYNKNPDKYKNTKPFKKITWEDYIKIIPSRWNPGLQTPVDPIAARLAKKEKIEVIVANGKNLKNLDKILKGEKFKGTIIY